MWNTTFAGYILTSNMSMFPDTDGSFASLYPRPNFLSFLRVLDKIYDRSPTFFERTIKLIDPITRQ